MEENGLREGNGVEGDGMEGGGDGREEMGGKGEGREEREKREGTGEIKRIYCESCGVW